MSEIFDPNKLKLLYVFFSFEMHIRLSKNWLQNKLPYILSSPKYIYDNQNERYTYIERLNNLTFLHKPSKDIF